MAPTKRSTKSDATAASKAEDVVTEVTATVVAKTEKAVAKVTESADGKLPCAVQFPLIVALSFALSTLGSIVISQVSKGELESLTRSQDTWNEVAIVAGWRM